MTASLICTYTTWAGVLLIWFLADMCSSPGQWGRDGTLGLRKERTNNLNTTLLLEIEECPN